MPGQGIGIGYGLTPIQKIKLFNMLYNSNYMLPEGDSNFMIEACCIPSVISNQTPTHGNDIIWQILKNNSDHGSSFFNGVEIDNSTNGLKIKYPKVKNVHNFEISCDQSIQSKGVSIGGTAGLSESLCLSTRPSSSSGFLLTGNGTNWNATGGQAPAYSLLSAVGGLFTLQNNPFTNEVDYREVQICYVGENNYRIKRKWSGLGGNSVAFYLVDINTNTVITTAPTSDDRVIISNYGTYRYTVNLAEWGINSVQGSNEFLYTNNFWVSGKFELWMKVLRVSSSENLIKWQEKTGVTAYKLYRDTNEDLSTKTEIYSGNNLSYSDNGLTSKNKYYYQLLDQLDVEITRFNVVNL